MGVSESGPRENSSRRPSDVRLSLSSIAIAAGLVLVAFALWRLADSSSEQACIDRVLAQYPAASVSAYDSPRATGSLKLSYDGERRRALNEC